MVKIRPCTGGDWQAVWNIFRPIVQAGDTYVFDPDTSESEALAYWLNPACHTFVAESENRIAGSYILKANQPGLGSHVANAAFIVSPSARGQGIGQLLGEHCLNEARRLGFRAMQFNFVVSTNEAAIRLWRKLGFAIVGTLPGAFAHREYGFVDAYVMYRSLQNEESGVRSQESGVRSSGVRSSGVHESGVRSDCAPEPRPPNGER